MKPFHKVLILFLFFPALLFAQGNYKPAFIVNLKGDTTKGFIELKEWGENPRNINFKPSLDKSAQTLTVNDIRVFELPGYAAYKSFATSISLDVTDMQKLEHYRDTTTKTDNVFLKVEQRGSNVTLYSYKDDLKDRYYLYDNQSNSINELTYRIYYVQNATNNVSTVSQDAYKQQLLLSAQKFNTYSDKLKSLIEDAVYDRGSLVEICRKINGNEKTEEKKAPHGSYIRFFVGAGVMLDHTSLTGRMPLFNPVTSYSSVSPRISAGFNIYPVPEVGKSVIKLEVAYWTSSYKTTGNYYYDQPTIISTYHYQQNNISVIPQFQYNIYNADEFKFYLNAGLSINLSTYSDNKVYNPSTNVTDYNFTGFNSHWFSVPLKAGITLHKNIDLSVGYSFPSSISDNVAGHHQNYNDNFNISTFQAGLSYVF